VPRGSDITVRDVNYILEVYMQGRLLWAFSLPFVNFYSKNREESSLLTWTMGDLPVLERSGVREERLNIRGRSGLRYRLGTDWEGRTRYDEGPALFREFERFMEEYQELAKRWEYEDAARRVSSPKVIGASTKATTGWRFTGVDPQLAGVPTTAWLDTAEKRNPGRTIEQDGVRMVVRALWEEHDLLVEPQQFNWSRATGSSRHSYEWDLVLVAYEKVKAHNFLAFGTLRQTLRASARAIDSASEIITSGTSYLRDTKAALDSFKYPVRALVRLSRNVYSAANAGASLVAWPREAIEELGVLAEETTSALVETWAALPYTNRAAARSGLRSAMDFISEARRSAVSAYGQAYIRFGFTRDRVAPQSRTSPRLVSTQKRPVFVHVVGDGETLQDVAEQYLGDRSRWPEVASINGISIPWVLNTGEPILPGAVLYVPAPVGGADAAPGGVSDSVMFGTDLRIGADGDLVASAGDSPSDVQTISGVPNFEQGLTVRLRTEQRQNVTFPNLGLPKLVGEPSFSRMSGYLAAHVRSQLDADRRVDRVTKLVVEDTGDGQSVDAEFRAVGGVNLAVTVPFLAL